MGTQPPLSPYAAKIAEYEDELDVLWGANRPGGGWRRQEPFARADVPTLRRLKWLLKRRSLLLQGRDWEVELVTRDPRLPHKVWAVPVEPPPGKADDPRAPGSPLTVAWSPPPATVLAFELHLPLAVVEAALAIIPEAARSDEGVRSWCRFAVSAAAAIHAAANAPAPAYSAPVAPDGVSGEGAS